MLKTHVSYPILGNIPRIIKSKLVLLARVFGHHGANKTVINLKFVLFYYLRKSVYNTMRLITILEQKFVEHGTQRFNDVII